MRGYTQHFLGIAAGLSQSAIASYESGRRHSSRASRQLARALQVNLDWLETGKGPRDCNTLQEPEAAWPSRRPGWEFLHQRDQAILEMLIQRFIEACDHHPLPPAPTKKPADEGGP